MSRLTARLRRGAAFVLLTLLAACSSKPERIDAGLRRGAEHLRAADWDKAGVEVRNVLQIDPRNARAHLLGAQVAEGQRDLQRAYQSHLRASELDPTLLEPRIGLARVFLSLGDIDKAKLQVEAILALRPGDVVGRTLQTTILARSGQTERAIDEARALVASSAKPPAETSLLLASLYANQGQATRALQVVETALEGEPRNASLLLVAAKLAADAAQAPEAAASASVAATFYSRAVELMPQDSSLWQAWSEHHLQRGELVSAEAVLRAAAKARPEEPRRVIALAQFLAAQQGAASADAELSRAIARRPKDMELRFARVELLRSAHRDAQARQALQDIVDAAPDAPSALTARTELARHHLAAAQPEAAQELIAQVLRANPRDHAALLLRARLQLRAGQSKEAVADLRAARRDQPGSQEAASLLVQAHLIAGEPQLAREVLVDAVRLDPAQPQPRLLLAALLADDKEFKAAQAELEAALKRRPDVVALYEAKARLHQSQKDPAAAEKTWQALKEALPRQPAGWLGLARFHAQQRRVDAALRALDEGLLALPGDATLWSASIGLMASEQRFAQAARRIDGAFGSDARQALPQRLRGELALHRNDAVAAEAAYRRLIVLSPRDAAGPLGLARALSARNEAAAALEALDNGIAAHPDDMTLLAARAEWLMRQGRQPEAIRAYEQLLERSPADEAANNNLAYLLAELQGDDASLRRALVLASRFAESRNPAYLHSLGWIHAKLGDHARALPLLERALALQPDSALLASHLGLTLIKAGEGARGRELLKRVIASKASVSNLDELRVAAAGGSP